VENVCGIGQMNKIVVSQQALQLEFKSAGSGYFANTGFLFYAIGVREYFANFGVYNGRADAVDARELNSVRHADRLQIQW
jgi:hypothetical protein